MEPVADLRQHLQRGRYLGAHVPSFRWAYLLTILSTFHSACNASAGKTTLPGSAVGRTVGDNASPGTKGHREVLGSAATDQRAIGAAGAGQPTW
jgi:hypothetical protein